MAGMDRNTGKALDGWGHVAQSLGDLFTTPRASRVLRRAYGSDLPRMVDLPMSPATIIDFYAAVAGAIDAYEPRFKVTQMQVSGAGRDGHLTFDIRGIYYPRGAQGDFSVRVPQSTSVAVPQLSALAVPQLSGALQ